VKIKLKAIAESTVTPGVIPETPLLESGEHSILVIAVRGENDGLLDAEGNPAASEHQEVTCEYPGGFTKTHQVNTADELFVRITGILRGRFGVNEITFATPAVMPTGGDEIKFGV
jgi:hypothetical protein